MNSLGQVLAQSQSFLYEVKPSKDRDEEKRLPGKAITLSSRIPTEGVPIATRSEHERRVSAFDRAKRAIEHLTRAEKDAELLSKPKTLPFKLQVESAAFGESYLIETVLVGAVESFRTSTTCALDIIKGKHDLYGAFHESSKMDPHNVFFAASEVSSMVGQLEAFKAWEKSEVPIALERYAVAKCGMTSILAMLKSKLPADGVPQLKMDQDKREELLQVAKGVQSAAVAFRSGNTTAMDDLLKQMASLDLTDAEKSNLGCFQHSKSTLNLLKIESICQSILALEG